MSCPVYVAIREDGTTLDTGDYDEFQRWLHEFPDAEVWCVDSFGDAGTRGNPERGRRAVAA